MQKTHGGYFFPLPPPSPDQIARVLFLLGRGLKQRRQLRKHHLKSEFGLLQTLSRLFHLVQFVKCWRIFLKLKSKGLYRSWGRKKESRCLVIMSSTKLEIRNFLVVVGERRQRNVQKCVMHVQNCCFVNLNLLLFWRSRCRCLCLRRSSLLKLAAHSVLFSRRPYRRCH